MVYYIIVLCFLLSGCEKTSIILAPVEQQYVDVFFRYLFQNTTAGYTLYGDKPFFICFFQSVEQTLPGTRAFKEALIFKQGIQALEPLKLQSHRYLLTCIEPNTPFLRKALIIVNKPAFYRVFQDNLPLFQLELGVSMTAEQLLNQLLSPNGFCQMLHGHEALQGILFGYGTDNAITYQRGYQLRKKAEAYFQPLPPLTSAPPSTPEELKEQIQLYIQNSDIDFDPLLDELADFTHDYPFDDQEIIPKIPFSFHLHSSIDLLNQYKKTEKKLTKLQTRSDFHQLVITRLSE